MVKATNNEEVAKALIECKGNILQASKLLRVDRSTVYGYIKASEELQAVLESTRESAIDYVESKLFSLIDQENPTAIIFYLKTQGRKRGYIEKVQNENYNINTNIDMSNIETTNPESINKALDFLETMKNSNEK